MMSTKARPCDDIPSASQEEKSLVEKFFGESGFPVQIPFNLAKNWHPRFKFSAFVVPQWLEAYSFLRLPPEDFTSMEGSLLHQVHYLYHKVLDNEVDRMQIPKSLEIGQTIALLMPRDKSKNCISSVVAAITFSEIAGSVVILFVAVDVRFQSEGFGSQLLMLVGKFFLHRKVNPKFYLRANPESNRKAWQFYTNLGFKKVDELPSSIVDFFTTQDAADLLGNLNDNTGLEWLVLWSFEDEFIPGSPTLAKAPVLFMINPFATHKESMHDNMIYARFPGMLTGLQSNWCGKGLSIFDHPIFHSNMAAGSDQDTSQLLFRGLPKNQFLVSWKSRAAILPNFTLLNPTLSMCLGWIQRNPRAKLWTDRVTLIPMCIMVPLWSMHFLFQQFLLSSVYRDPDFDGLKHVLFHPVIDCHRFMSYARIVGNYVLANADLFVKPYIIMFGENLMMDWTCFISVNAGSISDDMRHHEFGAKVSGFIHYDPLSSDECFRYKPVQADDPFLFFLTFARHLLRTTSLQHVAPGNTVDDFFCNTEEFWQFFSRAAYVFGDPYSATMENTRSPFQGCPSYVQLALPTKYPLRCPAELIHLSKICAFLFMLDFCTAVADLNFTWHVSEGIKPIPLNTGELESVYPIPPYFPFGNMFDGRIFLSKGAQAKKKRLVPIKIWTCFQENDQDDSSLNYNIGRPHCLL